MKILMGCPVLYKGAMRGGANRLRDYYDGVLGISEGIETAEAVYQATGISTWAAGNAGNLGSFVPPDDVTKLCIWADNDEHGVGGKAAEKLKERLIGRTIAVKMFVPPVVGEDWLDVLVKHGNKELCKIARQVYVKL